MNAELVLEYLNRNDIPALKELCASEIFAGKSAKLDAAKARRKLAEKFARTKDVSPTQRGAYEIDGKQMLCDGYIGIMFNDIMPGLPSPERAGGADLRKIIPAPCYRDYLPSVNIDANDLKNRLKVCKAERPKHDKKKFWLVKVGAAYYDAAKVLDVLPTLAGELKFSRQYTSPYGDPAHVMLIVEGENGTGCICPVNVKAKRDDYDPAPDTVAEYAEE